jgi:molecular chaperone DnaJ
MQVRPHKSYRREGDDIEADVTVPFIRAALGGELEIETLHGKETLRIPPGTAQDTMIRLRGKGVPHRFRSGTGDHFCKVKLSVPTALSPQARRILEGYEQELSQGNDGGVLGRLKSLFSG